MTSKSQAIKKVISDLLDAGYKDKSQIYDQVVQVTHFPRPMIRRCCGELLKEMKEKVEKINTLEQQETKNVQ